MAKATETVTDSTVPNVENPVAPVAPVMPTDNTSAAQPAFVKPTPQAPTVNAVPFAGDPDAHNAHPAVNGDKGTDSQRDGKLLTQAEIDAIVKERLDRAMKKYADYDELKAKVTASEDATRTEAEKQAQRLQELEQNAAKLAQERAQLLVEVSFKDAASEIGLPSEAAYKLADMAQAKFDDTGRITNAKELAAAVAAQYPGLVKRGPSASVVNPGRTGEQAQRTDADRRRSLYGSAGSGFFSNGGVQLPVKTTIGE